MGAALGTASPSAAEQVMEGIYTFNTEGSPSAEWTIYPICVPTVGDLREPLELPVACTLKIVSATSGKQTFVLNNLTGAATPDSPTASGPSRRTRPTVSCVPTIPVDRYPLVCEPAGNRLCR
ncbi:MAG: hypothetical protein WAL26_10090 [Mycobacterium sp.]